MYLLQQHRFIPQLLALVRKDLKMKKPPKRNQCAHVSFLVLIFILACAVGQGEKVAPEDDVMTDLVGAVEDEGPGNYYNHPSPFFFIFLFYFWDYLFCAQC